MSEPEFSWVFASLEQLCVTKQQTGGAPNSSPMGERKRQVAQISPL